MQLKAALPIRLWLAAALCVVLTACSGPACDSAVQTDPSALLVPEPMDREAPGGTPRMSLQDAARSGVVSYEVRGRGGSSGVSLTVQIRKVGGSPIDVYVTPGTIFTNSNRNAQRMVGWSIVAAVSPGRERRTTSMYLADSQVHTYLMEAYCLDIKLDNPSERDQLRAMEADGLGGIDVRAAQIIRVAKQRNLSILGTQGMLWMDHEEISPREIKEKMPKADIRELDAALETLKTLPPPKELGGGRQTVRCKPGAASGNSTWTWLIPLLASFALLLWPVFQDPEKAIQPLFYKRKGLHVSILMVAFLLLSCIGGEASFALAFPLYFVLLWRAIGSFSFTMVYLVGFIGGLWVVAGVAVQVIWGGNTESAMMRVLDLGWWGIAILLAFAALALAIFGASDERSS